jgi:hypothetical protein
MRATCRARWATCALALSICVPAFADHGRKSLSTCTTFDQIDKGDARLELTIRSTCSIPIDCAVSWRVVCAPDSKKRRAAHPGAAKFALVAGSSRSAEASATVCGDEAWVIDSVQWSCQPNKE